MCTSTHVLRPRVLALVFVHALVLALALATVLRHALIIALTCYLSLVVMFFVLAPRVVRACVVWTEHRKRKRKN